MLTVRQFCIWQMFDLRWFGKRKYRMPGVVRETNKIVRIHPRTYLERRMKGARR